MHDDKNELLSKIESQKLQISFLEETLKNLGHSNILLSSAYCKLKSYGHSEDISDPDNAEKQSDSSLTYNLQVPYTIEFARQFIRYFHGRNDVYANRYENKKNGKKGYYPQCKNKFKPGLCPKSESKNVNCAICNHKEWLPVTASAVLAHLQGCKEDCSDVLGIYPLFPNNTCRLIVFDFDNHSENDDKSAVSWKKEIAALHLICSLNSIPHLVERSRSGSGGHLWIFFSEPVPADKARAFADALLEKGAESVNLKNFSYYDRIIPSSNSLNEKQSLGNLIALPLQGRSLTKGNSAFVDDNFVPYPDQMSVLLNTRRISFSEVTAFTQSYIDFKKRALENTGSKSGFLPWLSDTEFCSADADGPVRITLKNGVYIDTSNLKPRLQNQIRRLAAVSNPTYYKNLNAGRTNYNTCRYIYLGIEDDDGYICIPRGLIEKLLDKLSSAQICYTLNDYREKGQRIDVSFSAELYDHQNKALEAMLKEECGILQAPPGTGKTVICTALIAKLKVSTLILMSSNALVGQWKESLERFLLFRGNLAEYETPTGRKRKRSSFVGVITGSKNTAGGIVDIAMPGSLGKYFDSDAIRHKYGLIIVDECHHSASSTYISILHKINAARIYGVTATPKRYDGLQNVCSMLLGNVRYKITAQEKNRIDGIDRFVRLRFSRTVYPGVCSDINEAYRCLIKDVSRNSMIVSDVIDCLSLGRSIVVLTRYVDHASLLYRMLMGKCSNLFLMTGGQKKIIEKLKLELKTLSPEDQLVIVATAQLIGEGFDLPKLDTLMLATPVSFDSKLEQYAGRLNREYSGKNRVVIYDYVDSHIRFFSGMRTKRVRVYKKLGYRFICSNDFTLSDRKDSLSQQERQRSPEHLYNFDNYEQVLCEDLKSAEHQIVIGSSHVNLDKVIWLDMIIRDKLEAGVKLSIVTKDPQKTGLLNEVNNYENLDRLKTYADALYVLEELPVEFVLIDDSIIWWGTVEYLGKSDVTDLIVREQNISLISEIKEKVFGDEGKLSAF